MNAKFCKAARRSVKNMVGDVTAVYVYGGKPMYNKQTGKRIPRRLEPECGRTIYKRTKELHAIAQKRGNI